jgi:hypothetical protein
MNNVIRLVAPFVQINLDIVSTGGYLGNIGAANDAPWICPVYGAWERSFLASSLRFVTSFVSFSSSHQYSWHDTTNLETAAFQGCSHVRYPDLGTFQGWKVPKTMRSMVPWLLVLAEVVWEGGK